jgi:RNA 2',3'-cyclic 3'-phosphodiesterase
MRLFLALDVDVAIRERIAQFRDEMRALAPSVRWVGSDTFHITLQFLGETDKVEEIKSALAAVRGEPVALNFRGTGFFPTPQRARVFWVGIEADENLQPLVTGISSALVPLGFDHEGGAYHPHLTLARAGSGRPHAKPGDRPAPALRVVHQKLEQLPPPDFGTMTAHDFILYQSTLSPAGSRYSRLARYPLG